MNDTPIGFAHQYAVVGDIRLHYVIGGEGPAVLLIHGWPFTWLEWRPLLAPLAAHGFTVIAPDLRGSGNSAKPAGRYTKQDEAGDLSRLVEHLGIAEVNVVGTDIGTMVAHAFAQTHPEQVRRLVLSEAYLPGYGLEDHLNFATGGLWHFGFHAQVELATMLTAGKEAEYLGMFWGWMNGSGIAAADRAELLAAYTAPDGMRGGFEHYATIVEDARLAREAGKISMPVLVLNGDHGLPHDILLEGARQAATDVTDDIIPATAHTIGADNPGWLAQRLALFFAG